MCLCPLVRLVVEFLGSLADCSNSPISRFLTSLEGNSCISLILLGEEVSLIAESPQKLFDGRSTKKESPYLSQIRRFITLFHITDLVFTLVVRFRLLPGRVPVRQESLQHFELIHLLGLKTFKTGREKRKAQAKDNGPSEVRRSRSNQSISVPKGKTGITYGMMGSVWGGSLTETCTKF
jgi:hypothetical protein